MAVLCTGCSSSGEEPAAACGLGFAVTKSSAGKPVSVFLASRTYLQFLGAEDGRRRWAQTVAVAGGPVVVGQTVVVTVEDGYVLEGRDVSTGGVRWRLGRESKAWAKGGGRSLNLAADSSLVYAGMAGVVVAVDPRNGHVVWSFVEEAKGGDPIGFVGSILPTESTVWVDGFAVGRQTGHLGQGVDLAEGVCSLGVSRDTMAVAFNSGKVTLFDTRSMSVRWSASSAKRDFCRVGLGDTNVVVASYVVGVEEVRFSALSLESGQGSWQLDTPTGLMNLARPVIIDGVVYMSATDERGTNVLTAVREASGTTLWRRPVHGTLMDRSMLAVGSTLWVNDGGEFLALDGRTGRILWKSSTVD